jgi:hypothetical protein
MAIQTVTDPLPYGLVLVRHYDDQADYGVDTQCGIVGWYADFIHQLVQNSLEYYNQPDGTNKFLKSTVLHVYAQGVPYEAAATNFFNGNATTQSFCCIPGDPGTSHINVRYLGNDALSYRFPASVSHEFGHAHHFWSGWPWDSAWGREVKAFLTRSLADSYPAGWNVFEAYANAYRCLKGSACTRGVSGAMNNGSDQVPAGMHDPNSHPEWLKQMNLLPELCSFAAVHGLVPGSLIWYAVGPQDGGLANGYFQLQQGDGVYVRQDGPYQWSQWVAGNGNRGWQRVSPGYTRH